MGRAYRGPYARPSQYLAPYATATVWGTGVDPVHSFYGEGPPIRVRGREGAAGFSPINNQPQRPVVSAPSEGNQYNPPEEVTWGYSVEYGPDSFGQGADAPISHGDTAPGVDFVLDGRPAWDTPPESDRQRGSTRGFPGWNRTGAGLRAYRGGAQNYRRWHIQGASVAPITADQAASLPTETVSEGWLNKVTSTVADAEPAADQQVFIMTSMRQRYRVRDNTRAQLRATDDARSNIASRVEAMVAKVYSQGERLYDMFPYQIDQMERPFRYRTAGVGPAEWLIPNAYHPITPIQRTPPPDPPVGQESVRSEYGYTGEDSMYYA